MTNYLKYLITAILAAAITFLATNPEPAMDPSYGETCTYEDILLFRLEDAAYDLPEGHAICLHIDQVTDAPTPDNLEGR